MKYRNLKKKEDNQRMDNPSMNIILVNSINIILVNKDITIEYNSSK